MPVVVAAVAVALSGSSPRAPLSVARSALLAARVVPVLALVAASAPSTASAMAVQPTWSGCGPRQESRCAAVGCPLAAAAPCEAQPKTGEGRERRERRGRLELALAAALAQPKLPKLQARS